jgi:hypothetical protein
VFRETGRNAAKAFRETGRKTPLMRAEVNVVAS